MGDTSIEWTQQVWNPTTGCDRVSPGCDRCYALTMARRLKGMGSAKYQRDGDPRTSGPGFGITEHPAALAAPLAWRTPQRVFVNSMSDLFHNGVSDEFIARVWAVMAATPQHTYQVLTKRHGRMRSLLNSDPQNLLELLREEDRAAALYGAPWPLPNVWLGVSAEDQKRADLRIPALLDTPAAVRFVSAEPLIGRLRLYPEWRDLDWVIVGGESGPGARRMELDWALDVVAGCLHLGIAPFVKQLGSAHGPHKGGDMATWPAVLRIREFPRPLAA